MTEKKEDFDLLTRIGGHDLFACEAQYHRTCRNQYSVNPDKWRSHSHEVKNRQIVMEQAHRQAHDNICITNDLKLIQKQGTMKMSDLLLRYTKELDKTPFPNPDYRSETLKAQLMKSYKESI